MRLWALLAGCLVCGEILKPIRDTLKHEFVEHASGLKIFMTESPETTSCTILFDVAVGYLKDPKDFPGTTHLLSKAMAQRSKRYPTTAAMSQMFRENKGSYTRSFGPEDTLYRVTISCEKLAEVLEALAEAFVDPTVDEDIVREKLVQVESHHKNRSGWQMLRDSYLLIALSNPQSAFSSNGEARQKNLDKPRLLEALRGYLKQYYVPSRFTLSVATPDNAAARALIEKAFAGLRPDGQPALDYGPEPFFGPAQLGKLVRTQRISSTPSLQFNFFFDAVVLSLQTRPHVVLERLVQSLEPGSFRARLAENGWSSGIHVHNMIVGSRFSRFAVNVDLTAEGLEHFQDVQRLFFEYVSDVTKDFQQYVYDDLRNSLRVSFDYSYAVTPETAAAAVIGNTKLYGAANALLGSFGLGEYSLPELKAVFERLQPGNALVILNSKTFTDLPLTEPVLGMLYAVEENSVQIDAARPALRVPSRSPFRPAVDELAKMFRQPVFGQGRSEALARNLTPAELAEKGSLHYFKDEHFGLPFAACTLNLYFDRRRMAGAENMVAYQLFHRGIDGAVWGLSDQLSRMNVEVDYNIHDQGFQLTFRGVSPSLLHAKTKVLEFINKKFFSAPCKKHFETTRAVFLREMRLYPQSSFTAYTDLLWESAAFANRLSEKQQQKALEQITFEQFEAFCKTFASNMFIETVITGHVSEKDAVEAFSSIVVGVPRGDMHDFHPVETNHYSLEGTAALVVASEEKPYLKVPSVKISYYLGDTLQDYAFGYLANKVSFIPGRKMPSGAVSEGHWFTESVRGLAMSKFEITKSKLSAAELVTDNHFYLQNMAREIDAITPAEFDLYRKRLASSLVRPLPDIYAQHQVIFTQVRKHNSLVLDNLQLAREIENYDFEVFKAKFRRDFVDAPKKFSMHFVASNAYESTVVELKASKYVANVFTSVSEFQKDRAVYPDMWKLKVGKHKPSHVTA